ncbi:Anti-sigma factor N-terminus [Desulfitobacterium hafniense]|uniref:Anti-sigma factor N-terminus n=1 Tax=Desulfitobacterium hafniense TaxID=49338 RepID=A0A098AXL2_DESHA|nr:anti-sigma factor domain-containing protein [Desulfitobacterium hafniense]CDX00855.1 Anti-sigma factor N-terminus [Desulfitobacterium hafniense]
MEKTKGIVMRTSKKVTAIYTEQGDFIEVPTPKEVPQVGDMIEVDIKRKRLPINSQSWLKYATSAAVLFLTLSLATFNLLALPNMAVASVSLDINKGIELLVNKDGEVIEIHDIDGGAYMYEGLSLADQDTYQAIKLIIDNAVKTGDLKESENLIFVRIVPLSKWFKTNLDDEQLKNSIQSEMTRLNISGNLVVGESSKEVLKEAQKHAMSLNDHIMYKRFQENRINMQPETIRNGDTQQVLSEANVNVTELFRGECTEVRSSMKSNRNEEHSKDASNSWDSEMGSRDNHNYNSIPSNEENSSSMHNNWSNEPSNNWHNSSDSTIPTPQSSSDSTNSTPQNSSDSYSKWNSNNENNNESWNWESSHDRKNNSSEPMNSWQDRNHNSDWSKNRSW